MVTRITPITIIVMIYGAIFISVPFFTWPSFWVYLALISVNLLFAIFADLKRSRRKREKYQAYSGYINLQLMSFFPCIPAVKVAQNSLSLKILIVLVWVLLTSITYKYRETVHEIVLGDNEKYKIYKVIFHGFIVVVLAAGGGGYYKAPAFLEDMMGYDAFSRYASIICLLFSYWSTILFTSMTSSFSRFK